MLQCALALPVLFCFYFIFLALFFWLQLPFFFTQFLFPFKPAA